MTNFEIAGQSLKGIQSDDPEFRRAQLTLDVRKRLAAAETLFLFDKKVNVYVTGFAYTGHRVPRRIVMARVAPEMYQTKKSHLVLWLGEDNEQLSCLLDYVDELYITLGPINESKPISKKAKPGKVEKSRASVDKPAAPVVSSPTVNRSRRSKRIA